MEYLGAWETLIHEKKLRSKISCQTPFKPTQIRTNREKYTFCVIKSLEHLKNLKTGRVPYLALELIMHVLKSQIHLFRQYL
jgi:hypothetical protein